MVNLDLDNTLTQAQVAKPGAGTAKRNSAAVDLLGFIVVILCGFQSTAGSGNADNTLDVKIQTSADGSTGWADVTGATFTQVLGTGGVDSCQAINVDTRKCNRYIRFFDTIAGTTPSFVMGEQIFGQKATV